MKELVILYETLNRKYKKLSKDSEEVQTFAKDNGLFYIGQDVYYVPDHYVDIKPAELYTIEDINIIGEEVVFYIVDESGEYTTIATIDTLFVTYKEAKLKKNQMLEKIIFDNFEKVNNMRDFVNFIEDKFGFVNTDKELKILIVESFIEIFSKTIDANQINVLKEEAKNNLIKQLTK